MKYLVQDQGEKSTEGAAQLSYVSINPSGQSDLRDCIFLKVP